MFSHAIKHLSDTVPTGTYGVPYDAEVEYIEGTGTQWIDTGIKVSNPNTLKMVLDSETIPLVGIQHQNVAEGTWLGFASTRVYYKDWTNKIQWQADSNRHTYEWDGNSGFYIDSVLQNSFVALVGTDTDISNISWCIGAAYQIATNDHTSASFNIRSYKIYINNQLVRDFIPVRVGTEYCLYDRANPTGGDNGDGLYHNKGTGAFLGGVDKPSAGTKFLVSRTMGSAKPYDAEVEYVESNGTQYVDTDIIMPDTYSFGVTFEALNSKGATWILFFGWRNGSYQYQFNYRTDNQNPGFAWDINSNAGRNGGTGYSNTWYTVECNSSGTNRQLVVNGTVLQTWTGASQNTNSLKAYLFASNVAGSAEQRGQMARVSRAWIKDENGNIVRDFVAVRVGQVGYLYDKVSGELFGSETATPLIAGPDRCKIKPILKHYDMAVKYRIDECNGNLQTVESASFPSGKYTALDYTPTYEHHRFVGWQNSSQDGEAEFLDSLPTGYTYPDGGNIMLTGVHPGPNTSFEIKAQALNQTMTNMYGFSGVVAANGECRWGCDETIDGVRTWYSIKTHIGEWSRAYAFYNTNNDNGNYTNFRYKSTDIGIFGYDASSKTVYTKTDANVVVNSKVLQDETTIKQFTGEFKFFGCPANSSTVSTTASLTCRPARLYYAKFWESGVLIRDYVPYLKDGVVCLYDKVNGTFLYNHGTGILMSGPLKATPVEYLESTGTQWIDTGIVPTDQTGFYVSAFAAPKAALNNRLIGCHEGSTRFLFACSPRNSTNTFFGWNEASSLNVTLTDVDVTASLNFLNDRKGVLNGETKLSELGTLSALTSTILLFGNRVDGSAYTSQLFNGRVYSAKISVGSTLVRDFQPVRIGQVGYLYDKVSGELFGSESGTPLIAGPDIGPFISPSDNIIYDAKLISAVWQSPTTVTFDATTNGGQMPSGWTAPDYYEGQPYGTLPTPTHATLNFTGWYINGSRVIASDMVQANATLVAQYAASSYSVDISNGDWVFQSPNTNPDTSTYDGVYQSDRYHGSPPSSGCVVKMYIDVVGYTNFKVYIRSYGENNWSYAVACNPDIDPTDYNQAINNATASTVTGSTSTTSISAYTEVNYTLDGGSHRICIVYLHKDSYVQGDDRGYLLIPKVQ